MSSPFRSLSLDASERSTARLRLVAAAVVGLAAVWVAALKPPPAGWLCVAVGLLASLMWLAMGMRARRRLADPDRQRLELRADGLTLVEGGAQRYVAWHELESLGVDEERLVVRLRIRAQDDPIDIEPRYGGLGAYDLEEAIRRARDAATEGPRE